MNHDAKQAGRTHGISRRTILRTAGIVVGAAASGARLPGWAQNAPSLAPTEYAILDAITARIIPADENGPGAREAMAARYIDRGLGSALAGSLPQYREGLDALDRAAEDRYGQGFVGLSEAEQDALLASAQDGELADFPASGQFFATVRTHTIQGTFSDPVYGGNADFVGWDMIGYPGVRLGVPELYQQQDAEHPPNHESAYDSGMFNLPEGVDP